MSTSLDRQPLPQTRTARLIRLALWVALGHVVVILILSPQLYWPGRDTPEALFERGQQALQEGKYAEAMELFRRVMDQQPKPPPVYVKAAEQHRLAERLGREAAGREKAEAEKQDVAKPAEPATRPAAPPPATQPRGFIPPELLSR